MDHDLIGAGKPAHGRPGRAEVFRVGWLAPSQSDSPNVRTLRIDGSDSEVSWSIPGARAMLVPLLLAMSLGSVIFGVSGLELGAGDARLGLASSEPFGPLGRAFGYWAPDLWPLPLAAGQLAGWIFKDPGDASPLSVRLPAALAGIAVGWLISLRLAGRLGPRPGILFGMCWLGCLGLLDHSSATGMDLIAGLATIGALDRLLTRGSDLPAGFWSAMAFLAGGFPPVLVVLLAVIIIGRREAGLTLSLLMPPLLIAAVWSAWALSVAPAEAWAAALTLPLTHRPDWWLIPSVIGLGLPAAPFGLLALSPRVRQGWVEAGRGYVLAWCQIALSSMIAGTIIPGISPACRVPALAGLMIVAASGLDWAWSTELDRKSRRILLAILSMLLLAWFVIVTYAGFVCTVQLTFYRPIGILAVLLSLPAFALGYFAFDSAPGRRGVLALVFVMLSLKLLHTGYFVPEWNYRFGQGPWGRAIGQWLLPEWTVYTIDGEWPSADLAFAIGRPITRLKSPHHLKFVEGSAAKHVILLEPDFKNWPLDAPPLTGVATFHGPDGSKHVLARTTGILKRSDGQLMAPGDREQ